MTARTLMRVLAVYYVLVLGAVWLAAPRSGLGHDHSAYALFVARVLGADLVIIGIMNWLISSQQPGLLRPAMWVNVLMNLVPVALSTVNVLNGSFGASGWVGVGAHAIPLAVLLCYLAYARTGREASAPGAAVPRARVQRSRTN